MKMIERHSNTPEQALLIEALTLVRTIQGAPVIEERYKPALPTSTINRLSQKLQEYVEGLFASNDDVDTEELTGQHANDPHQISDFPQKRQP